MATFADNQWFETHTCGKCGIAWAAPISFFEEHRQTRKTFWCPNGHPRVYRESTEDKLRRELAREKEMRDAAEKRASTVDSERVQITKAHQKMRLRVMNGVCPCCNCTFQNLMQHMKSEHPDFAEVRTLLTLRTAFGMTQDAVAREAGVDAPHVSLYERGKPVSERARRRIEGWLARHNAMEATEK